MTDAYRNPTSTFGRPSAWEVITYGGAAVAVLDAANATLFWYLYRGTDPLVIFQSIASGLLGRDAFSGGFGAGLLGGLLQCIIACGIAVVYYIASLRWPVVLRRPALYGALYGVGVYLVMNYIVVPLSQASPSAFRWPWFITNFPGHIFLVGMPVAFIARWVSSKTRTTSSIQ